MEIILPLADLIDKEAEAARLRKTLADLDRQLASVQAKLRNESFIEPCALPRSWRSSAQGGRAARPACGGRWPCSGEAEADQPARVDGLRPSPLSSWEIERA